MDIDLILTCILLLSKKHIYKFILNYQYLRRSSVVKSELELEEMIKMKSK